MGIDRPILPLCEGCRAPNIHKSQKVRQTGKK